MTWVDTELVPLDACEDALAFARQCETAQAAWDACERGDWLLWWIGRSGLTGAPESAERRTLVKVACGCARLALPHVPAGEERPRIAIETAERWADGDPAVTLQDVATAAARAVVNVIGVLADLVADFFMGFYVALSTAAALLVASTFDVVAFRADHVVVSCSSIRTGGCGYAARMIATHCARTVASVSATA